MCALHGAAQRAVNQVNESSKQSHSLTVPAGASQGSQHSCISWSLTHKSPALTRGSPAVTRGLPALTHGSPALTHGSPAVTRGSPAVIAVATLAVQMQWIDNVKQGGINEILMDVPCGRIRAFVKVDKDGLVQCVCFHCVPSFVVGLDRAASALGMTATHDLAHGGAFHAHVDIEKNKDLMEKQHLKDLSPSSCRQLIDTGMQVKRAVAEKDRDVIQHPFEDDLSFLCGAIFVDNRPQLSGAHSRNVCIFAEAEVDRSPTGSGVSGRMAIHHARGEMHVQSETKSIESIAGSVFRGSIVREETYGPYTAVIPQVEGTAFITGRHTFIIDPRDPMRDGFMLR